MNILITSIADLKKSQHNRPHQLVKYLSMKHKVTVLSINDWWKGGQEEDIKSDDIGEPTITMPVNDKCWKNPFNDWKAAEKIGNVITMKWEI